jgi:hypothetical protein
LAFFERKKRVFDRDVEELLYESDLEENAVGLDRGCTD